ncbi:hypothetical protein NKDENANG_04028 [Candidatus Entotheonellaceae bacterium PAL068K]
MEDSIDVAKGVEHAEALRIMSLHALAYCERLCAT